MTIHKRYNQMHSFGWQPWWKCDSKHSFCLLWQLVSVICTWNTHSRNSVTYHSSYTYLVAEYTQWTSVTSFPVEVRTYLLTLPFLYGNSFHPSDLYPPPAVHLTYLYSEMLRVAWQLEEVTLAWSPTVQSHRFDRNVEFCWICFDDRCYQVSRLRRRKHNQKYETAWKSSKTNSV